LFFYEKAILMLAVCGGVSELTRRYLRRTEKYTQLLDLLDAEFNLAFHEGINGEQLDFVLPNAHLSKNLSSATCCRGERS
jgi:hypothetical protein